MRLTRVATWGLTGLGLLGAFLAVLSVGRAGIGWDAPIDARVVAEIRAIPLELPLEQAYDLVFWTSEFYGLLIFQLAEGAHALITGSVLPLDSSDLATYRWQAGVVIALAVTGAAFLGIAMWRATRSALAGAFTWALIMAMPTYVGMSHVNFKDAPVAAGMSMLSAGLILSRSASNPATRWVGATLLMIAGSIVAVGTRVGSWPLLLTLMFGSIFIFALESWRKGTQKRLWATVTGVALAIVSFPIFLWFTNPFAQRNLPQWFLDSLIVMRDYPMDMIVRVAGSDFSTTDLPWWYAPAWLGAQLPILAAIGITGGLVSVAASLMRKPWALPRGTISSTTPVLLQGLALPAVIVLTGSVLYDGLRHILFILPALAAIAGIGIATMEKNAKVRSSQALVVVASTALIIALAGTWATIRWLPYSYAFINPLAGAISDDRAWELDYWGVSGAEGARRLQEAGLSTFTVEPSLNTTYFLGARWPDEARDLAPDGYGLYVFYRWDADIAGCESLFTIERDGQILGEGARCQIGDR